MNPLKESFSELTSDYLLQMRASGDGISNETHRAIEEIFYERGERLPPRPSSPILLIAKQIPSSRTHLYFKYLLIYSFGLAAFGVSKMLAHTWPGIFIMSGILLYSVIDWIRHSSLSQSEKEREDKEREAHKFGLSEMMICAEAGAIDRIRELIDYGVDVNARSTQGFTALMYAARQNHIAVVELLLSAGADPELKSRRGLLARDFAKKSGNLEIVERLKRK